MNPDSHSCLISSIVINWSVFLVCTWLLLYVVCVYVANCGECNCWITPSIYKIGGWQFANSRNHFSSIQLAAAEVSMPVEKTKIEIKCPLIGKDTNKQFQRHSDLLGFAEQQSEDIWWGQCGSHYHLWRWANSVNDLEWKMSRSKQQHVDDTISWRVSLSCSHHPCNV